MNNKQDKIFILALIFIIGIVLLWFPIKHLLISNGVLELQTTSNWIFYEAKKTGILGKIDDFIQERKTTLQNRITNYFPFYHNLNQFFYTQVINSNKLIYKDDFPINLNGSESAIFYNDKYDFYYVRNNRNNKDLNDRVIKQSNFFNSLYESNTDVKFNIYLVPSYFLTKIPNHNLSEYVNNFKNNLNTNINISSLNMESNEDYVKYFHRTDHHWNIYGAYEGYKDISKMMNNSPLVLDINQISSTKYYGSYAKNSLSTLTNDYIYDINVDLNYDVKINYEEADEKFKPRKITYNKDYDFFDYYIHYFNGQYGLINYTYDNESSENLLIFSDSYAWPIDYLIASHYKNTYVVNLRYDEFANGVFNYNKFIKENNINNVLFLYEGSAIVFDQYDYSFSRKIVGDK